MHRLVCVIVVAMLVAACAEPTPTAPAVTVVPPESASTASPAAAAADATAPAPAAGMQDEALVDRTIDNVLGDHAAYRATFDAFRNAVAANDAVAVSRLVAYPFTASLDGKRTQIADAQAFVAQYQRIVTPAIARAIAEQRYGGLFVNAKGVMIGSGEAWLNGICVDAACKRSDVRVVAIQPTAP